MAQWCNKHNRNMIPSKFGGEWCPDCAREKKESGGFTKAVAGNEEVLEALRKVWTKLVEMEQKIDDFIKIFSNK